MKIFILILMFTSLIYASSYSKSKKNLLNKVYFDNQISFYCNNKYNIKIINNKYKTYLIPNIYKYKSRKQYFKSGKENYRAKRIEWEHIMPAHNFGKHLSCWKEGGRKACKNDKIFRIMTSDMHNLVPAIGEINNDRSNFRFGAEKVRVGQYGKCEFQVDFKRKRAYVKDDIKGDIARIYFYMSDKYNVILSKQERKMMEVWNKLDPVDKWEMIKNERVLKLQGNSNPYIK